MRGMILLVALSLGAPRAFARDPACEHLAAHLVLLDSLYGVAFGSLMSGLWAVSQDEVDKIDQKLASGALVGAGIGMGFGVYELATRNCSLSLGERNSAIPKLTYDLNKDAMGLTWQLRF